MRLPKKSIAAQISNIKRIRSHRNEATGQIWQSEKQRTQAAYQIQVQTLFASDEGTFILRRHKFNSKHKKRTPAQWQTFLQKHYGAILRDRILPGINDRTDKQWRLYRVIGWYTNASAKPNNAASPTRRNKKKQKR